LTHPLANGALGGFLGFWAGGGLAFSLHLLGVTSLLDYFPDLSPPFILTKGFFMKVYSVLRRPVEEGEGIPGHLFPSN